MKNGDAWWLQDAEEDTHEREHVVTVEALDTMGVAYAVCCLAKETDIG